MNAPELLTVQTLNRHQNHLKMYQVNAVNNSVDLFFEEQDDAYVDIHDNLTFLEDDDFIWTSERDGFNHLYLYNADGTLKRQITSGDWEVTSYYGYDAKRDRIFYQSTEQGSTQRHVYSINAKENAKPCSPLSQEQIVLSLVSNFTTSSTHTIRQIRLISLRCI